MPERANVNFDRDRSNFRDSVCIDCNKIMDSCRDKDCLEDLKVFLCDDAQEIVNRATNIRCLDAKLVWTQLSVEPVPFNRGFFQVDVRFFFKVAFEACVCLGKSHFFEGIVVFDKKVILFGSEGNVNIFRSNPSSDNFCALPDFNADKARTNLPIAVCEVVDPVCLCVKIVEPGVGGYSCCSCDSLPDHVRNSVSGRLVDRDDDKDLLVTLGLFSIIRLERPAQIVVPCSEYCIPDKECTPACEDDPCQLFKKMKFPLDEFFPSTVRPRENIEDERRGDRCERGERSERNERSERR